MNHSPDCLCAACMLPPQFYKPVRDRLVSQYLQPMLIEPGTSAEANYAITDVMALRGVRLGYAIEQLEDVELNITVEGKPVYPRPIAVSTLGGIVAAGDGPETFAREGMALQLLIVNSSKKLIDALPYAVYRSLEGALAIRLAALMAIALCACSSGSSSSDAGDADGPRWDGDAFVGLVDAGEDLDAGDVVDAAEDLDAGDVDAEDLDAGDVDAAEDLDAAADVDAAALAPCELERDRRMCHAASCDTLCQVGSNLSCCDGTAGELELCACEAP